MREDKGRQIPIYCTSRVIEGAEANYSEIEKLGLALVTAARKLRPYFLSHSIVVRTIHPLKAPLGKIEIFWRMLKWVVELGQFEIYYEPRSPTASWSMLSKSAWTQPGEIGSMNCNRYFGPIAPLKGNQQGIPPGCFRYKMPKFVKVSGTQEKLTFQITRIRCLLTGFALG